MAGIDYKAMYEQLVARIAEDCDFWKGEYCKHRDEHFANIGVNEARVAYHYAGTERCAGLWHECEYLLEFAQVQEHDAQQELIESQPMAWVYGALDCSEGEFAPSLVGGRTLHNWELSRVPLSVPVYI